MSNWVNLEFYCPIKGKWHEVWHLRADDPRSKGNGCRKGGGKILINRESLQEYCTVCGNTWPAEELEFYCDCGQMHTVSYSDSATIVQADRGFMVSDGEQAYIATHTDIAAIEQRHFHNIRAK